MLAQTLKLLFLRTLLCKRKLNQLVKYVSILFNVTLCPCIDFYENVKQLQSGNLFLLPQIPHNILECIFKCLIK